MRNAAAARRGLAAAVSLCLLAGALTGLLAVVPASAAPSCPYRTHPVPAVDTSEVPRPGTAKPKPLPVPEQPTGGARMGECGVVLPKGAPPPPTDIGFRSWMLTDLSTGAVLAAKDPHGRQRPASLAKILLGLLVAREADQNAVVTGTQTDANQEGTRVGIGKGGKYTVNQLLHGLLMCSGNDIAHALAVHMGGFPQTLRKMNELAQHLGTTDTRITSPSGLDGPGMSTSAYDLSLLFRAAMNNKLFAQAVHTSVFRFPGFPKNKITKKPYRIYNDNQLLDSYPGDIGGKTGFTDDAQHTFANAAQRHGHRIALIMMYGDNHLEGMYRNAHELMDYGFQLAAAGTAPVGKVLDEPKEPAGGAAQVNAPNEQGVQTPEAQQQEQGHPVVLWIVGVLFVLVVLGAVLTRRLRRRANR